MPTPSLQQLLEFEAAHHRHTGDKETRIIAELGIAPARYYQLLRRVIGTDAALMLDPILTHRLRREDAAAQADYARRH